MAFNEKRNQNLMQLINRMHGLVENDDLELYTPIEYVVGAICKELTELKE